MDAETKWANWVFLNNVQFSWSLNKFCKIFCYIQIVKFVIVSNQWWSWKRQDIVNELDCYGLCCSSLSAQYSVQIAVNGYLILFTSLVLLIFLLLDGSNHREMGTPRILFPKCFGCRQSVFWSLHNIWSGDIIFGTYLCVQIYK